MPITVPWNAAWSGESHYEIRPCRYAGNRLALWQRHAPGTGRPLFAKPHAVRQRMSVAMFICTVCGVHTQADDRWWFKLGNFHDRHFATTEAPVHRACADLALSLCPHLKARGCAQDLSRFPRNYRVLAATLADSIDEPYGVHVGGRTVIGHLKFAWPEASIIRSSGHPHPTPARAS